MSIRGTAPLKPKTRLSGPPADGLVPKPSYGVENAIGKGIDTGVSATEKIAEGQKKLDDFQAERASERAAKQARADDDSGASDQPMKEKGKKKKRQKDGEEQ